MNYRTDFALLLLRIIFGGTMLVQHGWGKLLKFFQDDPIKFADPIGFGPTISLGLTVFAEVVCALLLIFGLFSRWSLIPLIFIMLVAIFIIHWGDPLANLEKAILYLTAYLSIFIAGPGWYSIDEQFLK